MENNKPEDDGLPIVRTKRCDLKPMNSEEAVLQKDMLGHSFFIYIDVEANGTNIVYHGKAGRYALIEMNESRKY